LVKLPLTLNVSPVPTDSRPLFVKLPAVVKLRPAPRVKEPPDWSGPKVFAGEYAAQTSGVAKPDNRNNWKAAISEAVFITGLERNGDVIQMASYAPLMAHVEAWQWTPDAIWFDNLRSYGTPDYYVQMLFATTAGTRIVPVTPQAEGGVFTSASLDEPPRKSSLKSLTTRRLCGPPRSNWMVLTCPEWRE